LFNRSASELGFIESEFVDANSDLPASTDAPTTIVAGSLPLPLSYIARQIAVAFEAEMFDSTPLGDLSVPWPQNTTLADEVLFCIAQLSLACTPAEVDAWDSQNPTSPEVDEWHLNCLRRSVFWMPKVLTELDLSLLRSILNQSNGRWELYDFLSLLTSNQLGSELIQRFRESWYEEHHHRCWFWTWSAWNDDEAFDPQCFIDEAHYLICDYHRFEVIIRELSATSLAIEEGRGDEYVKARKEELKKCSEARKKYDDFPEDNWRFYNPFKELLED
jgi:hypothetical protein